jgi:S-(hydroxymethyl)glutathione dehydrogenase / alcohol dehydrogenase
MTVRAALMRAAGAPLEVVDLALDDPAPDQVRVRIAATGVCHSDLSARAGAMGWKPPLVLGHEGAGIVAAVGSDVDPSRLRVGDHVIIAWNQPCRTCSFCIRGEPHLCANATRDVFDRPYGTVDGEPVRPFLGGGTFAEETLVLARACVGIPGDVPLEHAALVGCAVTTGVGAVRNTARVFPGQSVAVVGCGAVGLSVVQGARLAGATTIVAIDPSAEKRDIALELGATHVVDPTATDPVRAVKDATERLGADHAFEVVGRAATIRQAYDMSRRGGQVVVVGVGSVDEVVEFNAMELFFLARTIVGCVYGSADPDVDFPRMLTHLLDGKLDLERLITSRIGLDEVDGALDAMARGEGLRAVVTFD